MNKYHKAGTLLTLSAGCALAGLQSALAQKVYIAAGDSLAYGYMNDTLTPVGKTPTASDPTDYYPGYVAPYTAFLTQHDGGIPVDVIDLGISGETTNGLFSTTIDGVTPNAAANSGYGIGDTQAALLEQDITNAGSNLGVVTIQVGANDVLDALAASFNPSDPSAAIIAADTAIGQVGSNYQSLLSSIQSEQGGGPLSKIVILGDYNPYAGLSAVTIAQDPFLYSALKQIAPGLTQNLNSELQMEAADFGARYVDLYDPFLGKENADTLVNVDTLDSIPNDHPNAAGYALIAQQLAAPEPSSAAGIAFGFAALAGLVWRARRCPSR